MAEECTHDCSSCGKSCSDKQKKESFLKEPHKKSSIKKVIAVVSGKGGVGKSLTTSLLAAYAHKAGKSVGIMDADITGPSIPKMFGVTERASAEEDGLNTVLTPSGIQMMSMNLLLENENDPVIWRGMMIAGTVQQFWTDVIWRDVDLLFIDMPPGTGDVPLTVFQSIPIAGVVVVTTPQDLGGKSRKNGGNDGRARVGACGKHELSYLPRMRQKNRSVRAQQGGRNCGGIRHPRGGEAAD